MIWLWYNKYLNIVGLYFVCRQHNYPILKQWYCKPNAIPLINKELLEVSNLFKTNKLSVYATKTNCMSMGTLKMTSMINQTGVISDNTELDRVIKTEFLGVIIDENLTWKNHIDGKTKTISRNMGMINKLKFFFCFCFFVFFFLNEFCSHCTVGPT